MTKGTVLSAAVQRASNLSLSVSFLVLIGAVAAPQAMAQGSPLEEIVVTAQFREQNLQQTPLSITAMTGELMEARGYTKISDVTDQAPNVQLKLAPAGRDNSMSAYIRGVGQADQSPSVDPGVGIYIDDVYFASLTGSALDLLDLDRVEVLRGPQGTLAGMNSMGGAVKLFSRKPEGEGGYVEGTIGSFNRTDISAVGDFTLVEDKLFARLSGISRHRDGYVKRLDYACTHPDDPYVQSGAMPRGNSDRDCQLGTLGGQAVSALRLMLRWVASDDIEVNISADGTHDRSESQPAVLRATDELIDGASLDYQGVPYDNRYVPYGQYREDTVINDPYVTYANFLNPGVTATPIDSNWTPGAPNGPHYVRPINHLDGWGVSGTVDWQVSDLVSLKSITGYRGYKTISGHDNDGSPVAILQTEAEFKHEQFSQELRLNGSAFDSFVDYTVGGIYFRQETTYAGRIFSPFNVFGSPELKTFDFIQDDTTVNRFYAGFAHAAWHLTDRLTASTGIRYTKQDKDYTFNRLNIDGKTPFLPLSNPDNPLNGTTGNFKGSHVDYRLSLDYQWTDDVMTYAQYATGFKGGGISPRPYYPQQVLGFGQEELVAYEIGLKSRFFDQMVQFNTAAFYNDYKDYQAAPTECVDENGDILPAPYNNPCGQYANVADAKVKGFEIELQVFPVEGLQVTAAYSYLDFEFKEPFIETNSIISGASAPGVGDESWSVGAQYEMRIPNAGSVTPRVDVVYTDGYCGNLECTDLASNSSYTLVNGRITYMSENGDWRVALEGRNLTDKIYSRNIVSTPAGYTSHQIAAPREWAVSVRRNF